MFWARGWVHGTQRGVGQLRVSRVRAVLYILSYLIVFPRRPFRARADEQ